MGTEELANQAAERVRALIKEAEDRAAQIVREAEREAAQMRERAEAEAARIRERAEADIRERLERARQVLTDMGSAPSPASTQPAETAQAPAASAQPANETDSPPPPEAEAALGPAAVPSAGIGGADEGAARLVAMKMALDGKGRDEIESALAARFGAADRGALLDDVLARAGR